MKRFRVAYSRQAELDLQESFDWGVERWGLDAAVTWAVKLDDLIQKNLSTTPLGYPLAPEDEGYDFELRQMPIRRYRVLYTLEGDTVFVLRIRGPFNGQTLDLF
jgi:plasmid stabilization system protein ParE